MDGPRFARTWLRDDLVAHPGAGLIVALLLSLGLWGAIWLLAEDGARPIIFYNRFAYCWQPQVKGWTMMVNSIINNWRRKTSPSTGNLGARPSCRPGCVRGDWAGHRSGPDRFFGFGSATNLTGKIEPALARNRRFESSCLQRRVVQTIGSSATNPITAEAQMPPRAPLEKAAEQAGIL